MAISARWEGSSMKKLLALGVALLSSACTLESREQSDTIDYEVRTGTSDFYQITTGSRFWRIDGGPFGEQFVVNLEGDGVGTAERFVGAAIPVGYRMIPARVRIVHLFNRTGATVSGTIYLSR